MPIIVAAERSLNEACVHPLTICSQQKFGTAILTCRDRKDRIWFRRGGRSRPSRYVEFESIPLRPLLATRRATPDDDEHYIYTITL